MDEMGGRFDNSKPPTHVFIIKSTLIRKTGQFYLHLFSLLWRKFPVDPTLFYSTTFACQDAISFQTSHVLSVTVTRAV